MRAHRWGWAGLALAAGLAAAPAFAGGDGAVQMGRASWYGREHAGHPTASGEAYDPEGLTAAHRTLPLGTVIEVAALGRVVTVRVNDRGPFVKGRVLDLSAAAARVLGLDRSGTALVSIRPTGAVCPANRPCPLEVQVADAATP
ncbi:MAG: septal ring lytic transglycosylase RlpA family protein [Azospirillaceae bacterium]|nr:septal ring lytic transglycosylase RlpA family protein [Azospirillaceae bacterium]